MVGEGEFAVEDIARAHGREIENGGIDRDDGSRHIRFEDGLEEDFVAVLDGDGDDFPFDGDEAVRDEDRFAEGDAWADHESARAAVVAVGGDAVFVATGREDAFAVLAEVGFAVGVRGYRADEARDVFILELDGGIADALVERVRVVGAAGWRVARVWGEREEVDHFEEDIACACWGDDHADGDADIRVIGGAEADIEEVFALGQVRGWLDIERDRQFLADGDFRDEAGD